MPAPDSHHRRAARQPERTEPQRRQRQPEPWDRIGWHPDHVIEISISPEVRKRDPTRPLSLREALDLSRAPKGQPESDDEPEAEP